ncbi:hypothetical protein [Nocardia sp. NPDC051570]|uniref:hypothetical protein n=1 Tax=Nocardia sp. NPDC051570 TaxID=3364324 RepID=UPI00379A4F70
MPTLAVIVEVQLRPDLDKAWSWPVYVSTLRARLRAPTLLLVICPNERAAAKCRRPITITPGCVLTPIVLSPADVPVITDPQVAAGNPELTALSALAHRRHPDHHSILAALAENVVDDDICDMYIDLVLRVLPKAVAQHFMESLMTTGTETFKSDFARRYIERGRVEGKVQGKVEGEASALLAFLRVRFTVPEPIVDRITTCTDPEQLVRWIERAATAQALDDVFGE